MKQTINPSTLGDFIKLGKSDKDLRIIKEKDPIIEEKEWKEGLKPINAVSIEAGLDFEEHVYEEIKSYLDKEIDTWKDYKNQEENNQKIISAIEESYNKNIKIGLFQAKLSDDIEHFHVPGDADLINIIPNENSVDINIYDIKSAWEEKTHHRIQTSAYSIIIKKLLERENISINYNINTGIITKSQKDFRINKLPKYESSLYERDIKELLSKTGSLNRSLNNKKPDYSIDKKDDKNFEIKMYESLTDKNIRLLELTIGEQKAFREIGIKTISEIADITKINNELKPYKSDSIEIKNKYTKKINKLEEEHGFSKDITKISLKAKSILDYISPEDKNALSNSKHIDKFDLPWIPGSGQGNLPEDNPPYNADLGYEEGSMIRIYLNTQIDYVNDSISGIAARVSSEKSMDSPKNISVVRDEPLGTEEEIKKQESKMIKDFTNKLFNILKETKKKSVPIHFYLWDDSEYTKLIEILRKHNTKESQSLLNILSQREGVEQKIYTTLQDEIRDRLAFGEFVDGPLNIYRNLYPYENEARVDKNDFTYSRNGKRINIRDAMNIGLFDHSSPYKVEENQFNVYYKNVDNPDGFYCLLPRFSAQIPLEYLWASKENNLITPDWSENPQYSGFIENYRWIDSNKKEDRIEIEDYKYAMNLFCKILHHIERGIVYRNSNIEKKKLEMNNIEDFKINNSFKQSLIDYMRMEYSTEKKEKEKYYSQRIKQRVVSGKSIPIKKNKSYKDGNKMVIEGETAYEELDLENPERISSSCRINTDEKNPWMVISPINKVNGSWIDLTDNRKIKNSPLVELQENDGSVRIETKFSSGSKEDKYLEWHRNIDDILDNEYFILDSNIDNNNLKKMETSIKNSENNTIYNLLKNCLEDNYKNETEINKEKMEETLSKISNIKEVFEPNKKQKEFILDDNKLNIVQGPPGTGKTKGAIANSLLCRLKECQSRKGKSRILVSGPSNKSIDEVLTATSELLNSYNDKEEDLENTLLIRLTSDKPKPSERLSNVEYINHYKDEEEFKKIYSYLKDSDLQKQKKLQEKNIIVYTTPSTYHNIAKKHDLFETAGDAYSSGMRLFDHLLVDEASMMVLPQFITLGAFLEDEAQILIAGDHRQMPPVQKHEWKDEQRINIMKNVPFLSVLNYIRFLRGDKVERIKDNNIKVSPNIDINITGLNTSYRCHSKVSEILNRWIYSKDNINYQSEINRRLEVESSNFKKPLKEVYNDNKNIVIIMHDDYTNQQTSFTEAQISRIIMNKVKGTTKGIVTPHNAQKGMLKSMSENDINIDTVERYQGGEKSLMVVSSTVSDPEYLKKEKDFILSPNRLNVAVSRMQSKLIIIAPKTIFKMIPNDKDMYEKTQLWKYLLDDLKRNGDYWSGDLNDFGIKSDYEVNIEILSK